MSAAGLAPRRKIPPRQGSWKLNATEQALEYPDQAFGSSFEKEKNNYHL